MASELIISKMNGDEYKKLAKFMITYGTAETKFGKCLLAMNENRICYTSFFDGENPNLDDLKKTFPNVIMDQNDDHISTIVSNMFNGEEGKHINILLKGTDFETSVWEELVTLKKGSTITYEGIAKAIGKPKAIRAVANAIAKNNIAYLVPCHRVIHKTGGISKYRWGANRKLKMLKYEEAVI